MYHFLFLSFFFFKLFVQKYCNKHRRRNDNESWEGPGEIPISVWVCLTTWFKGKNPNGQLPSLYGYQNDNVNVVRSQICDLLKVCSLHAIDRANLWHKFKLKTGLSTGLWEQSIERSTASLPSLLRNQILSVIYTIQTFQYMYMWFINLDWNSCIASKIGGPHTYSGTSTMECWGLRPPVPRF